MRFLSRVSAFYLPLVSLFVVCCVSGAADDSATAETHDGEEDAEDTDDPDTPESLEDEQKRLMLQEALQKEQQPRNGPKRPGEGEGSSA